jgi:hypothetical protein
MAATSIELKFADGDYLFALPIPQLIELERSRGAGILEIYGRLMEGWFVSATGAEFSVPHAGKAHILDITEFIRLSLIGGGKGRVNGEDVTVSAIRARELVDAYCYPAAPIVESWAIAKAAAFAVVEGYEPAEKKSPEPAKDDPTPARSTKRKSSPTARA